jgi:hypothetical protein
MYSMNEKTPQELFDEIENDTTGYRHDRGDSLHKVTERFEKKGDNDTADKIKTEAAALMLCDRGDSYPGFFQPFFMSTNGVTIPPRDFFTVLTYLAERAKSSKNPIHSSKYADVVWDLSKEKDAEIARIAIARYLELSEIYKRNKWGVEFGDVLKRAAELCSMINDKGWIEKTKDLILKNLNELDKDKDYRFCLDLAEAITRSKKMELKEEEWETFINVLDNGINYYQGDHKKREEALGPTEGPNEHLVRSFHEVKLNLKPRTPLIDADSDKLAMAKSYEREGDRAVSVGNQLRAVSFYLYAERSFRDLGKSSDRDRVRVKLSTAGVKAEEEMTPISTELKIEKSKIEEDIKPLLKETLEDTLKHIAATPHFIPNVGRAEERVEKQKSDFPLQFLFPSIHFQDGHVVGTSTGEEELATTALTRDLVMEIKIGNIFRGYLFDMLRREYKLNKDSLLKHFEKWGYCKPRNLKILEKGFEHYFQGDYVSAVHMLIPQFEDILRNFLLKAGRPISIPGWGVAMLNHLLSDAVFKQVAGINLICYYELTLCDPDGINLRNDLAHGLMDPEAMNKSTTELILHLLLTLTRFHIGEK